MREPAWPSPATVNSRRAWVPVLRPVRRLQDWCESNGTDGTNELSLVAALDKSALPIKRVVDQVRSPKTARVIIGPEGDFTPDELQLIIAQGFTPITLGPLTLRAETASIAALAVLTAELSTELCALSTEHFLPPPCPTASPTKKPRSTGSMAPSSSG